MFKTAQPAKSVRSHLPEEPVRLRAGGEQLSRSHGGCFSLFWFIACLTTVGLATADEQSVTPAGQEVWFRIDYDDEPAGYEYLFSRSQPSSTADGTSQLQVQRRRKTELKLKRFGRDLSVSSTLTTLESPDGQLLQWSLTREAGDGTRTNRSGVWMDEDSRYEITEVVQATRRTSQLTCSTLPRSPIIAGWVPSLLQRPETRLRADVLFPESGAVASVRFERKPPQSIQLRTGQRVSVIPIVMQPQSDPQLMRTFYLTEAGEVIRSVQHVLGRPLILERTEAAQALAASGVGSLDLDTQALIPVNRQISQLKSRDTTRLRIIPLRGNAINIPAFERQLVQPQSDGSVIVTILRPQYPGRDSRPAGAVPQADRSYLMPTDLLNFETDPVRVLTLRAGGPIDNAKDQCERMTRYLFTNLRRSRFSTSLVPAAEIAKSMRGDCTEHATLLAAMMRSRGIPARVVTGLVYVERVSAFTSHMWTEAYIDGSWLPFDSATGAKGTGADRIKLSDSALDFPPSGAVALFLPLLPLLNDTKIELLSDQPDAFER